MKRYLCLLAFGWLACFVLPVFAADDHVALIKRVTGQVNVIRDTTTVTATSGSTLLISDRLVVAPNGSAGIVFKDGTLLTLGSGADVLVRDYVFSPKDGKFAFSLYMTKGSAIYESGKIGKLAPESVKIDTPKATVGVRGTRFLIETN